MIQYNKFVEKLYENYQQAKKWMIDNKKDLKDRGWKEISDILKNKQGWMFPFILFYYEEKIVPDELKKLYQRLEKLHNKRMISDLPKDPSQYYRPDPNGVRTRFEELSDDVKFIERLATAIEFVNKRLTSALKTDYKQTLERVKKERTRIRNEKKVVKNMLDEYVPFIDDKGLKEDFKIIEHFNTQVQKLAEIEEKFGKKFIEDSFYLKISKYTNFEEFSKGIDMFIESLESGFSDLLNKVDKFNGTKNDMYKIRLVYPENPDDVIDKKLGVFEYNTFQSSKIMGSPNWCIVTSIGSWNTYVGAKGTYRRQYAIHNYNLSSTDPKRMIGITTEQNGGWHTSHDFNDGGVSQESLREYCKKWKIPYEIFQRPVTAEQKKAKDKAFEYTDLLMSVVKQVSDYKISSDEKRKLGKYSNVTELNTEILDEFKENYADFSSNNNALLIYTVGLDSSTDKKKHDYAMFLTEYVLKSGAFPENEKIMEKAKSADMIELLIKNGAQVSNSMILRFLNDGNMDLLNYMFERTDFLIKKYATNRLGEKMREFKDKYSKSLKANITLFSMMGNKNVITVINDLIKKYNL